MSSTLPRALRRSVLDRARVSPGFVRCAECNCIFPESHVEVDHITPEANGGSHDPINLQVLCAPPEGAGCHRIKSREEAKVRAVDRRERERPNVTVPLVSGCGAAIFLWTGYRLWHGATLDSILADVQRALVVTLAACVALAVASSLAQIRRWLEPVVEEEDDDEGEGEPMNNSLAPRFGAALAPLMGDEIDVRDKGEGVCVSYNSSFADHDENARFRASQRINMKLGGRWKPTWDGPSDSVTFTRRPEFPAMIRHPGLHKEQPWWLVPFSPEVTVNLNVTSHILVIGKTNAGKTAFMRNAIVAGMNASRHWGVELILVDPKRVELIGFRGWPGVRKVVTTDEDLWDMALHLKEEVEERYRLFEEEGVKLNSHKAIIVILDEYEEYVKRMHAFWNEIDPDTDKPRRKTGEKIPPPVSAMASVLALARRCMIHVIIGTQRPDAAWFGGSARDNMQARFAVGPLSINAARMLFEQSDHGRDLPADAKGRFTYQQLDNEFIESQAWYVPDPANSDERNTQADEAHLLQLKASLT